MLKHLLTDPRVIGSAVACLFLHRDDLPGQPYGTFRDPGGALLLSIIFAQTTAVVFIRQADRTSILIWLLALIAKHDFQRLFYVQNALLFDLITLVVAHLCLAALVRRALRVTVNRAIVAALLGCIIAPVVSCAVYSLGGVFDYHRGFWGFASARITFPYFFWTSLLIASHTSLARTLSNDDP
jgi:hypothetical protein